LGAKTLTKNKGNLEQRKPRYYANSAKQRSEQPVLVIFNKSHLSDPLRIRR